MPDSQEEFEVALANSRHAELRDWINGWNVSPPESVHQIHMHFVFDDGCCAEIGMNLLHRSEEPEQEPEPQEKPGFFREAWFRMRCAWACLRGEE